MQFIIIASFTRERFDPSFFSLIFSKTPFTKCAIESIKLG